MTNRVDESTNERIGGTFPQAFGGKTRIRKHSNPAVGAVEYTDVEFIRALRERDGDIVAWVVQAIAEEVGDSHAVDTPRGVKTQIGVRTAAIARFIRALSVLRVGKSFRKTNPMLSAETLKRYSTRAACAQNGV
ncbi:MAG: hypothetical protein JO165_12600 [Candidatus Eremiobacteraeota bacterium]|nr:hypothetical protein [Candidatus Eremiobacteraeota bacterium]